MENNKYSIQPPLSWINPISDLQLLDYLKDSEYSESQISQGKDFCYLLQKIYHTSDKGNSGYVMMAYTLTQPDNLKSASVYDVVLNEEEHYLVHRISVLREGVLIDKLPDTTYKVMDIENESQGGILSNSKKVNVTIKDLRLHDILILEETHTGAFTEKDLVRSSFYRNIIVMPDIYWAYGKFEIKIINDRSTPIDYEKRYFRDENGNLISDEKGIIEPGSFFNEIYTDYSNPSDPKREVFPYYDFATVSSWKESANFILPYYEEVIANTKLEEFAPDLLEKLHSIPDLEDKISYAIEFVQNQIRYIYNAYEMNRHLPQKPEITYQNKQGDCKAKTVLLKTILDRLGVVSEVVLVSYRTDNYLKEYLPSLLAFNHVILKVQHKGNEHFVDATYIDEFGHLGKRDFIAFMNYLPIRKDAKLVQRPAHDFPDFSLDEVVNLQVRNNVGTIKINTKYRYNRANYIRRDFKSKNKRTIIDSWNQFIFDAMNYRNDRNTEDLRTIFKNAEISILNDDKAENLVEIEYTATVENAYFKDRDGNRFLMFFDYGKLKSVKDYMHKDILYWHEFDKERMEIHMDIDENIDTKEKYTIQEATINHKYLKHSIKKNINKNGGSAYIEFCPINNVEIPMNEIDSLKKQYEIIADSNMGLGIDIIEKGLGNQLKFMMKKWMK